MTIEELQKDFRKIEDKFLLIKTEREKNELELQLKQLKRDELVKAIDNEIKAINFIENVANEERREVKEKVERLITSCLHEVFDDTYSVEFDYGVKGSRTSVEIYMVRKCPDGLVVRREINGIGGGVADAIALPLKLIVLLNDKDFDKVLICDEPGKHLDVKKIPKFAQFMTTISKKLNVQVLMSSHHEGMEDYADSINYVELNGSKSKITKWR